ncbi:MAG: hypothetical protein ACO2PN_29560 [Pyrobaculum sp.]
MAPLTTGRYRVNFLPVSYGSAYLDVYWLPLLRECPSSWVVSAINQYAKSMVASLLSRQYQYLKEGIYIASLAETISEEYVGAELKKALTTYFESREDRQGKTPSGEKCISDDNNISQVQNTQIPSTGYVVANLLKNALEKIIKNSENENILCHKIGAELCLRLEKKRLESLIPQEKRSAEPLLTFCDSNSWLCGNEIKGKEGCSRFFKVVKEITLRFQHVATENITGGNDERIYVMVSSTYRRISNLTLYDVIDFLRTTGKDIGLLNGVRVNKRLKRGTDLCKVVEARENKVQLKCLSGEKEVIDVDTLMSLGGRYTINPTYKHSRDLIEKNICEDMDKHKDLITKIKRSSRVYFMHLTNDVKLILGNIIPSSIILNNVKYQIGQEFLQI